MNKLFLLTIPVFLLVSCQNDSQKQPSDADKDATAVEASATTPAAETDAEPSEIYVALNSIMDKSVERINEAETPDKVIEAANQYYDEYWALANEKFNEWSTIYTPSEKEKYNLRDKEFVSLLRSRYLSVGGTKEDLHGHIRQLMVKCMQYDHALKTKLSDEVQDSVAAANNTK